MKYLISIILLFSCAHNLERGLYRRVSHNTYIIQIKRSAPNLEETFERAKDGICLRFHQRKALVLQRLIEKGWLVSKVECSGAHHFEKSKASFGPTQDGVGDFFINCGKNKRCK